MAFGFVVVLFWFGFIAHGLLKDIYPSHGTWIVIGVKYSVKKK